MACQILLRDRISLSVTSAKRLGLAAITDGNIRLSTTTKNNVSHDVYLQFELLLAHPQMRRLLLPLDRLCPGQLPYSRNRVIGNWLNSAAVGCCLKSRKFLVA